MRYLGIIKSPYCVLAEVVKVGIVNLDSLSGTFNYLLVIFLVAVH